MFAYSTWLLRILALYKSTEGWVFAIDEWGKPLPTDDDSYAAAEYDTYQYEQQSQQALGMTSPYEDDPYFYQIRRTVTEGSKPGSDDWKQQSIIPKKLQPRWSETRILGSSDEEEEVKENICQLHGVEV